MYSKKIEINAKMYKLVGKLEIQSEKEIVKIIKK